MFAKILEDIFLIKNIDKKIKMLMNYNVIVVTLSAHVINSNIKQINERRLES